MILTRNNLVLILLLSGFAVAQGDDSRTNAWQMQVGWVHQWGRGMSVSGPAPSISGGALLSVLGSRELVSSPNNLTYPDNTLLIPRLFDDGYVSPDIFTGDPGLLNTERYHMTWNWGAGASQYNFDGGVNPTLTYHLTTAEAVLGAETQSGGSTDNSMPTDGVEFKFSRRLYTWTNCNLNADGPLTWTNGVATLDLVLGVALFPKVCQHVSQQASLGAYAVDETYVYSDYYGANGYPPLTFPYAGTMGTFGGDPAGPLIPELPDQAYGALGSLLGTARDRITIDSEIWRLRGEAGLTLTKEISPRWSVYVSPQLALEFVSMSACRRETLTYTDAQGGGLTTIASRTDNNQKTTLIPGFLLTGGADCLVSENWFLGASLGWEWLARDPSLTVGNSHLRFALSGGECSIYCGRHF